jgi:hypothetical protein
MLYSLPPTMHKTLKRSLPVFDHNSSVSISIDTYNPAELPKFGSDSKTLKCSGETQVWKLLDYLSTNLNFSKNFICKPENFDPKKYVEIVIELP